MEIKNEAMLITYPDSLGKNLKDLEYVLDHHLKGVVGGVHILPFFPSSGDRGFSPMDYTKVDESFGGWEDIKRISEKYYMMYEFMLNHISAKSPYYLDFLEKKEDSPYKDYFIRYNEYWPENRPTEADIDLIYKRKPKAPFEDAHFKDGTVEKVWCTFSEEQIDLNVATEATRAFIKDTLTFLADKGASVIRLDAFAYAVKRLDTNCFFVEPDIWEMLEYAADILRPYQVTVLPEIHEHYTIQQKIAEKGYPVYDFALPMLVLHALYSGKAEKLLHWLDICPRNQFTTLDTHDGIGVVDVKDLLTQEEVDFAVQSLYEKGANLKRIYSSEAYNNLDIYQINCTYYSALGNNDDAYLLARAIQCFTPGIPQIYYVGLFAGENDLELLENSKEGRNINRHYYSLDEIKQETERAVVKDLFRLLAFRNTAKAFDGELETTDTGEGTFTLTWKTAEETALLTVDLPKKTFAIVHSTADGEKLIF
ncbi:sucrose phosphorylase gfta [Trichococcus palustris]|jgi:sucrose phosphorylase|uniref:Sucrose phosphorylase n=1 Tax=Trichococcus palustris TaxID=140314 RepID=A0A143YEZ4_9LACT|nr:sucrose phosphorylase [Trichococcus palustris]CZQ85311.1 sucrose phosphorylase gfta [Trichococcus palustris]SFK55557.1 sucrose phosphorylase [Trichococcus palustris]